MTWILSGRPAIGAHLCGMGKIVMIDQTKKVLDEVTRTGTDDHG